LFNAASLFCCQVGTIIHHRTCRYVSFAGIRESSRLLGDGKDYRRVARLWRRREGKTP
jgi:hypothetical protein